MQFHPVPGVVETRCCGEVGVADYKAAALATLDHAPVEGCHRLLMDCTALTGGYSVPDLYQLADVVVVAGLEAKTREAVLIPAGADMEAATRFWAANAHKRGLEVKVFNDRSRALSWLGI